MLRSVGRVLLTGGRYILDHLWVEVCWVAIALLTDPTPLDALASMLVGESARRRIETYERNHSNRKCIT